MDFEGKREILQIVCSRRGGTSDVYPVLHTEVNLSPVQTIVMSRVQGMEPQTQRNRVQKVKRARMTMSSVKETSCQQIPGVHISTTTGKSQHTSLILFNWRLSSPIQVKLVNEKLNGASTLTCTYCRGKIFKQANLNMFPTVRETHNMCSFFFPFPLPET